MASYKIFCKVKPNAKEEKVEEISPGVCKVSIKEPPRQGRANLALIEALAKHFEVPPSRVRIISGQTSKQKIIEII